MRQEPLPLSGPTPNVPAPDLDFDPITLDPHHPAECPCPNDRGVYAWVDSESREVLRVGKAKLLRNRLQQYWNGTIGIDRKASGWKRYRWQYSCEGLFDRWFGDTYCESIPWVLVWFTGSAKEGYCLEHDLIAELHPPFNKCAE